ncbi:MAG: CPBP family intramembrane metalloprotease [Sphingomonadales bacterium]|nr:CPBP family intramembrane metalloprotease [Sphingomonadales bacterium]
MSETVTPPSLWARLWRHPGFLLLPGIGIVALAPLLGGTISGFLREALGKSPALSLFSAALVAALSIFAYWVFVHFVEKRPFTDFSPQGAAREWGFGAAVGFGLMTAVVGVIAAGGGYAVQGTNPVHVLVPVLAMALGSGVVEEVLVRGVIFRLLEEWLGSWAAIALSAALFGLAHMGNPNASLWAAIAIALEAGILLGAVYMVTRRLWAAIGLHMAWNFTQTGIYGVAVSGLTMDGLLRAQISGPELLTGGAFGAEASLPAIILCTLSGVWFLWRAHKTGQVRPSRRTRLTGVVA